MASYLYKLNSHVNDQYIEFDEPTHVYTVKGNNKYTSVTTWNHSHFEHFDAGDVIKRMEEKGTLQDPSSKYFGKTKSEILEMWKKNGKEASESGTKTHLHVEYFYNKMNVADDSVEYQYFMNFVNDHPNLEAYRTEWCVYDEDLKVAGSIDMVFKNKENGEFYIYDWKRSKGIVYENPYGKTAITSCINHISDSNFWHYALQLNVYRRILKLHYNIEITKLCLVVLHPNNKNYNEIELPFMDEEMESLWKYRQEQIKTI